MTFKPFRFALLAFLMIFTLVRCGGDTPTGVVAIALDLSSATLRVGTTVQVNASVTVGGVASTQTVTFSSDNSAVLSVTPGGLIRALSIGTANLTATASGGETKTAVVTVIAGLPFAVQKTAGDGLTAAAGSATATPPSVTVRDSAGNALSGVTVTFAVTGGGGSVTGGSTTTNASGSATAGAWTLGPNAGTNTLTATAAGVSTPATFTATATAPLPASVAINGGNGQTAVSGSAVAIAPSVIVRNSLGQPAAGVTVIFSVGAGGGVVSGSNQVTNASGIATVGSWNLGAAGVNTLNATAAGLPVVTFTATATAAPTNSIGINAGNGQAAVTGTAVATPPSVIVLTPDGQPVSGTPVTFAVASGGGSITGGTTTTNGNGIATVGSWTLGAVGPNTLTATATGLGTVTFTATATAAPVGSLTLSSTTLTFASIVNGAAPPSQTVQITNGAAGTLSGLAIGTISYTGSGSGWLFVNLSGTTAPTTMTVGIASALPAGTYGASFPVIAAGAVNSPQVINVTLVVAPPTQIIVTQQPAGAATGVVLSTQPIVRVADGFGATLTTYNGAVTAALVGSGGVLNGTTTVNAVNGVATFTNLAVTGLGTFSLQFSSPNGANGTSGSFLVTPLPPTQVGIRTQPAGAVSNTVFSTQPVVELRDVNGNLVAGASGNVTVALGAGSGGGALSGTLTVPVVNGVATFTDLKISAVGSYTLAFTSGALTGITSPAFSVTAAPPVSLGISTQPAGAQTGSVFSTQPVVQIRDAALGTVVGATNAVTATLNGAGGSLSGTTTVNAVNGVATFTDLKITGAGTYTITFSSGALTPATSASLVVAALPPTQLAIGTQPVGGGTGLLLPTQPVIQVKDAANGVVNGASNPVTATLVGAGGTLSGTTTVNAVNGIATFTDLRITGVGSYTLSFTSPALTAVTSGAITISTLPPTKLAIATQPSASTVSGSIFATQPVVQVQDQSSGVVAAANNPVTATLSGAGGTLSGTTTVNAVNGIATFTDLKVTGAGTYTIVFSSGALTAATTSAFAITPLPATQLVIQTQPGGAATGANLTPQPVVHIRDASDGTVAGATNAVTATLNGAGGTLSGTTTVNAVNGVATFTDLKVTGVGNYTITFASGALTAATSASFGITALPPAKLAVLTQPSGAVSGSVFATQPVIQVQDASNGVVNGATNAVTATLSGAGGTLSGTTTVNAVNGVATFTDLKVTGAGNYTIVFSAASLTSATSSSITITPLPATQLAMQTQPAGASANVIFTTQPIVQVKDASNGVVAAGTNPVTATLVGAGGTLSGTTTVNAVNGIATFTNLKISAPGTYSITFSAPGLTSVTSAPFTVTVNPAVSIAVNVGATATANAAVGTNITVPIIVDMANSQGQNLASVTFKVTWDPAKFDYVSRANGTFGTAGSFTVNTANTAAGELAVSIFDTEGFSTGAPTILNVTLAPKVAVAGSAVGVTVSSAGDVNGFSLSPSLFAVRALSVTTAAAPPTKLSIQTQPSGAVSNSALTTQPVIQVQDASGGVVAGATNSVTATLNGAGGTLSGTTTVAAVNGIATFTDLKVTGAGSYTITFSSGALTNATSNAVTITAQPAVKLGVSTQPGGAASGALLSTQPVVQILDASNGVVAGATDVVTAALGGGSAGTLSGTTTITAVNGVATFTDLRITGAGSSTIVFTSGVLAPATSNTVSTSALPATKVVIATQPSDAASGAVLATQPVVQLQDASNVVVAGAGNSVTATLNGAGGTLSGTTTVNAVNGTATFTDLKVTGAGTFTITFTSGALTAATSNSITITALPATHLFVAVEPNSGGISGQPFTTQPVVHVRDASNGIVNAANNSVTATINGAGGLLFGTTTKAAVNGVVTFTDLDVMPAGTYTITFASAGLTSATTASFTVVSGAAHHLAITTQPTGNVSGSNLNVQPVVRVEDITSSPVTAGAPVIVTAILNGAGGTLGGTTSVSTVNGVATFTNLRVTGAGSYTISFTASGLDPATSNSITITTQTATQLVIVTQPSPNVTGGVPFPTQPVIEIRDASNNIVAGSTTSVTATVNGPGNLQGTTTVNAVNGVATFTNLNLRPAGTVTLTFSSSGLTSATSNSITTVAGPPAILHMTTQPVGAASGALLGTQPVIDIRDNASSVAITASNPVTATLNGAGGTLSGTTTVNAVNGLATFTDLRVTGAGSYTLTFTSAGLTQVISSSFTVSAAPATQLAVSTQPAGAASGVAFTTQPVVQVRDASNGVVAGASNQVTAALVGSGGTLSGTLTVTAVNGVATFTNLVVTGAGTYTLTFTSSGLTQATSSAFTVTGGGTPTINLNVGASANAAGTVGTPIAIPIIADMSNAGGQNLASITFNVTWDPTKFDYVSRTNGTFGEGPAYTVNASQTGNGQLAVSIFDNDGFSTGSPTILTVTLTPKTSATATVNTTVSTAGDVNGAPIATSKFVVRPLSVTTP